MGINKYLSREVKARNRYNNLAGKLRKQKLGISLVGEIVPGGFALLGGPPKVDEVFVLTAGIVRDPHSDWQKFRSNSIAGTLHKLCDYLVENYEV